MAFGPESGPFTPGGTPAAGDWVNFTILRDPASDTFGSDAYLLGVLLRVRTNAEYDAA